MKLVDLPEARQIAADLTSIKDRLGRLGLFETMHLMDAPTGKLGFEIEEHLQYHARQEKTRDQADAALATFLLKS